MKCILSETVRLKFQRAHSKDIMVRLKHGLMCVSRTLKHGCSPCFNVQETH